MADAAPLVLTDGGRAYMVRCPHIVAVLLPLVALACALNTEEALDGFVRVNLALERGCWERESVVGAWEPMDSEQLAPLNYRACL